MPSFSAGSSRTSSLLAVTMAASLVALSACSTDSEAAGSQQTSSGSGEPVVIEHALGEAVIEEQPERVITLGQGSAETAIALGVVPVGVEEYPWGADDTGYLPWVQEAVTAAGAELPKLIPGGSELDIEAILELDPDVILAPWSGLTQEQYDILSDIAPTVAYAEEPWTITWEEQIETVSQALWQPEAADDLIAEIESEFSEAAQEDWEDLTFSYIYNDGPGTLGVFFPGEQRVAMVSNLGLTVDPAVEDMGEYEVPGTDSAMIGLENADMLSDSDLIFTWYFDEENREEIESQELYGAIPAIADDAVVISEDNSLVTASSMINPLTVPWVTERYIPLINEAIDSIGSDRAEG